MDYAPPARPDAPDNDSVICPVPLEYEESFVSDEYAFSTGIPPEFTPIRVVAQLTGVVRGQGAPGECEHIIEGAEIDAWQINPTDLNKFTATTMREEVLGTPFRRTTQATPRLPTSMTTGPARPLTLGPSAARYFMPRVHFG